MCTIISDTWMQQYAWYNQITTSQIPLPSGSIWQPVWLAHLLLLL